MLHLPGCRGVKSCEHHKEERRGEWIIDDADTGEAGSYAAFIEFHCSNCGLEVGMESGEYGWGMGDPVPWIACPVCGADMRGKPSSVTASPCGKQIVGADAYIGPGGCGHPPLRGKDGEADG